MMKKPNILLFVTDEHRLSGLSCFGNSPCKTPNIDKLAKRGVLFSNTYTTCPLCTPARASLITGLHTHAHGMVSNQYDMGCDVHELPDSPRLLSRRLADNGYKCGYVGKWHLGYTNYQIHQKWVTIPVPFGPALPSNRGFDAIDYSGHGSGGHYYPDYKDYLKSLGFEWKIKPHNKDGEKITGYGITDFPKEGTVSHYLTNQTISKIKEYSNGEEPFFIWHNDWGPHGEHWIPQEYYDLYKDVKMPKWESFDKNPGESHPSQVMRIPNHENYKWEDWEDVLRYYYGFCTLLDEELGRVMETLEEIGQLDNTIIIFTSDHGETLGTHDGISNKGFSHYDDIQRIPFIVSAPNGQKGIVDDRLCSLTDVYYTILDYANEPLDRFEKHGRSVKPIMEGKTIEWRDCVFVEFFGLANLAMNMVTCRCGNMKYGWNATNKDELYDLSKDPEEINNLIDHPDYKELLLNMRRKMYTFMRESEYPGCFFFLRSRLNWNIDRQFIRSEDPYNLEDNIIDIKW